MHTFLLNLLLPLAQLLHAAQIFIGCLPNTRYTSALQDDICWALVSKFPVFLVLYFPCFHPGTSLLVSLLCMCFKAVPAARLAKNCLPMLEMHVDSGSLPGDGNGNLLQYSCLETPMDRATVRITDKNLSVGRKLNIYLSTTSGIHWCSNLCLKVY